MQKLKNLVNPGGKHDDEVLYGSGQSSDPVHSGTAGTTGTASGPGSHLGSATTGAGGSNPLASVTNSKGTTGTTGTSGYDSTPSGAGGPLGSRGVGSSDTYGSGNTISNSRMPESFGDPGSTASIKSGVLGAPQSGSTLTGSSDVNKALPHEPAGMNTTGRDATTGPHESRLAEHLHGSRGVGSNSGTDSGLTGSALPDRSTAHHQHGGEREGDYSNLGTSSGRSFPLGGSSNTTSGTTAGGIGSTGTPTAPGTGADIAGYGPDSWGHNHPDEFQGDPCGPGENAPGVIHFHEGPHATETANLLDPHVKPREVPISTVGTGHHGDSATGTGVGLDATAYPTERAHPGHDHAGTATAGTFSSSTGTGLGPTSRDYDSNRDTHRARDTLAGGAIGATGAGAYEGSRRDDPISTMTGTGLGSTSREYDITRDTHHSKEHDSTRNTHHGRDALAGGAAGTAAAGAYEESRRHDPASTMPGSASSTAGLHESKLAEHLHGARGVGSNELEGNVDPSTVRDPSAGYYEVGKHLRPDLKGEGATGMTGPSTTAGSSATGTTTGSDHPHGRDAGLAGAGVGGAAAYAGQHHHNEDPTRSSGLSGTTAGSGSNVMGVGDNGYDKRHAASSTYPPSGHDDRTSTGHHRGERDAAVGAAGAGAGAAAGAEFSKKDAEHAAKQRAKEEAKHEKALEKEEAKLEKSHAKEEAKHEKHHEKHHEEAKHEKHHEEEKHEKKHGGLFGFLHRDKPDKELKEEEAARKGTEPYYGPKGAKPAETGLLAGSDVGMTEHEREQHEKNTHERNRLHKDPPASIAHAGNTNYANEPEAGYASQVTGGTGTTALAEGDKFGPGRASSVVTEPHTGLPMDTSKGDGRYGTDDTPVGHVGHGIGGPGSGSVTGTTGTTGTSGYDNATTTVPHESKLAQHLHGERAIGSNAGLDTGASGSTGTGPY